MNTRICRSPACVVAFRPARNDQSFCSGSCRSRTRYLVRRGRAPGALLEPPPLRDRFYLCVTKGPGCWEWAGSRYGNGYGMFSYRYTSRCAHRVAWEIERGPIPEGLQVCHHCDNPPCVRIDHLFIGTQVDNMADAKQKGRHAHGDSHGRHSHPEQFTAAHLRHQRGSRHPLAKVTLELAERIRSEYAESAIFQKDLAAKHGLGAATVFRILRGDHWATPDLGRVEKIRS